MRTQWLLFAHSKLTFKATLQSIMMHVEAHAASCATASIRKRSRSAPHKQTDPYLCRRAVPQRAAQLWKLSKPAARREAPNQKALHDTADMIERQNAYGRH